MAKPAQPATKIEQREIVRTDRIYVVNNVTGDDAQSGTDALPFRTIKRAVAKVCDETYWDSRVPTIRLAKTGRAYDEQVVLRPWRGAADTFYNTAIIEGDPADPTYQTGVLVKPTAGSAGSVVTAVGNGARWSWRFISVDGSAPGVGQNCYSSIAGGYLRPMAGDMGLPSPGYSHFFAHQDAAIYWDTDWVTTSHLYGVGTPDLSRSLLFAINNATISLNAPIHFDDDPGFWVAAWAEQNSFFQFYHQARFTGVHPVGQRILMRENARGNTGLPWTDLPGDSWTSATGWTIGPDSTFFAGGAKMPPVNSIAA